MEIFYLQAYESEKIVVYQLLLIGEFRNHLLV